MRDVLKSSGRWLGAGWFWPLVLLVLPNCQLGQSGLDNPNHFNPGFGDLSFAVMCDIPHVPTNFPNGDCADATDLQTGMPKKYAAIALAQGEQKSLVLDFSQEAQNACGVGVPQKLLMFGQFPDGEQVCLNCPQMIGPGPTGYENSQAVCVAKCKEQVGVSGVESPGFDLDTYCKDNAHVSTNFDVICYENVCDGNGNPKKFDDPRRPQEPVKWADQVNTSATLNNLTGTTGQPQFPDFTAFAAVDPDQLITTGDAWVEFQASENDKSHVLGMSTIAGTDPNPALAHIDLALSLNFDHNVYILENGNPGAAIQAYVAGDRFRVRVKDNNDGTATISYTQLDGACTVGTICKELPVGSPSATHLHYPLRVRAAFREANATLANVTLVRIIE